MNAFNCWSELNRLILAERWDKAWELANHWYYGSDSKRKAVFIALRKKYKDVAKL